MAPMADNLLHTISSRAVDGAAFKFYHYKPTIAGAAIFIVLFAVSSAWHMWQAGRTRSWFMIPLILGGLFEVAGYSGRVASSVETPNWTLGPYIVQAILLLVAPALFAATIYMALGRLVHRLHADKQCLLPLKWMTKIFVGGDVISFLLQAGGGGLQAGGTQSSLNMGSNLIVAGLFVQLAFFIFFVIVAASFQLKLRQSTHSMGLSVTTKSWEKHMLVLFLASALILIRSVVRVVEYLQGFNGYILEREVFLYVFDAVLMFLVMALFNFIHPSKILGKSASDRTHTADGYDKHNSGLPLQHQRR